MGEVGSLILVWSVAFAGCLIWLSSMVIFSFFLRFGWGPCLGSFHVRFFGCSFRFIASSFWFPGLSLNFPMVYLLWLGRSLTGAFASEDMRLCFLSALCFFVAVGPVWGWKYLASAALLCCPSLIAVYCFIFFYDGVLCVCVSVFALFPG